MSRYAVPVLLCFVTMLGCGEPEASPVDGGPDAGSTGTGDAGPADGSTADAFERDDAAVGDDAAIRCGNGVVEGLEECDDGDANSDSEPDACRTDCVVAGCGDEVTDDGEQCDTGDLRSDSDPDACRLSCALPSCGDGVSDDGESCDDGNEIDDDACRNDCSLASCGDGTTDDGEECDDGNRIDGDGCQADCSLSECTRDRDCRDGVYCNGAEQCVEGVCEPGTARDVDDGVDCTVDTCDEDADMVVHTPDNRVCRPLTTDPVCATSGANAGRLVRDVGRCNRDTGCVAREQLVDDCLDDALHPTTFSCRRDEIRRHEGVCVPGAAAMCGATNELEEDCNDSIPSTHPVCTGSARAGDLTWHHSAVAMCGGARPRCSYTEMTDACVAGGPRCSAGELTTRTPTCANRTGCGVSTSTRSCSDSPSTCTGGGAGPLVLTTFTPACGTRSTCGPPTESRTTCTAAPTCEGLSHTTWTPICDATRESCGRRIASAVDCTAFECAIFNVGAGCVVSWNTGVCDPVTGCGTTPNMVACPPSRCSCAPSAPGCLP